MTGSNLIEYLDLEKRKHEAATAHMESAALLEEE